MRNFIHRTRPFFAPSQSHPAGPLLFASAISANLRPAVARRQHRRQKTQPAPNTAPLKAAATHFFLFFFFVQNSDLAKYHDLLISPTREFKKKGGWCGPSPGTKPPIPPTFKPVETEAFHPHAASTLITDWDLIPTPFLQASGQQRGRPPMPTFRIRCPTIRLPYAPGQHGIKLPRVYDRQIQP